jgi:hypothetical protein
MGFLRGLSKEAARIYRHLVQPTCRAVRLLRHVSERNPNSTARDHACPRVLVVMPDDLLARRELFLAKRTVGLRRSSAARSSCGLTRITLRLIVGPLWHDRIECQLTGLRRVLNSSTLASVVQDRRCHPTYYSGIEKTGLSGAGKYVDTIGENIFTSPKNSVVEFRRNGRHMPKVPQVSCAIQIIAMLAYFFRHTS